MTTPESSLRERAKARRRAAIQRAGMRLFAERGYGAATVADIAEEAEVATRTVSTYFPTKLHIAMSASTDLADRLIDAIEAVPEADFSQAVERWLAGEAEIRDPELTRLAAAMFETNPGLRAVSQSYLVKVSAVAVPALLAEAGLSAGERLAPVIVAAVGAAITEYVTNALQADSNETNHNDFVSYLRAMLAASGRSSISSPRVCARPHVRVDPLAGKAV